MSCPGTSCELLLSASTALAIRMGQTCTAEELGVLGAFFAALGDQLTLLSLCRAEQEKNAGC